MVCRLQSNCKKHCDATSHTTKSKKNTNQLVTTANSQVTTEISAVNSQERKTKPKTPQLMLATTITKMVKQTLTLVTRLPTISTQTKRTTEMTKNRELFTHPLRPTVNSTIPQKIATLEQTQLTDRLPGTDDRKDRIRHNEGIIRFVQMIVLKLQPKI